jgi:hypothetical protein
MLICSPAMQFDEVLEAFTAFFERERIRYAVIGGLAVHAWGGSRLTRDVDLVAERSDQARIISFAESLGYETLQSTEAFSSHVHSDPKMGRVDLLCVNRETADKLLSAMPSKVEPLDELAGDLALTRDENEQLWRVRRLNRMNAREYLDFLVAFTERVPPSREVLPEPKELFEL